MCLAQAKKRHLGWCCTINLAGEAYCAGNVSVVVALAIGSIETLGLVADELGLDGGIWNVVNAANDNFGALGYAIIGVFVASWLISLVVYRVMGYDKLNP